MTTVEEILLQTGFSPSEIAALDQRARAGFGEVLSAAEQAREAAELAQRSNRDFYDQTISPALNSWDLEKNELANARTKAEAEAAFYRAQAEAARESGLLPRDAPGYQPRDNAGRYIPSATGSPTFDGNPSDLEQKLAMGLGNVAWALQSYQRLHGGVLPDDVDKLAEEAGRSGRPFRDYVAGKYKFVEREREIQEKKQREHDDKIRNEAVRETDRKWAERTGSNPDIKQARASALAEVSRGVQAGTRPDPLKMSDSARQQATKSAIHERIMQRQDEQG